MTHAAPDIIIVVDVVDSESAIEFVKSVRQLYGDSVLVCIGNPSKLKVFGCPTVAGRSLPELVNVLIDGLSPDEQNALRQKFLQE